MEATMLQTALLQNPREYRFDISRSYDVPYLVDKDIVEPILVVGVPAELAVFLLLCFQCQQSDLYGHNILNLILCFQLFTEFHLHKTK